MNSFAIRQLVALEGKLSAYAAGSMSLDSLISDIGGLAKVMNHKLLTEQLSPFLTDLGEINAYNTKPAPGDVEKINALLAEIRRLFHAWSGAGWRVNKFTARHRAFLDARLSAYAAGDMTLDALIQDLEKLAETVQNLELRERLSPFILDLKQIGADCAVHGREPQPEDLEKIWVPLDEIKKTIHAWAKQFPIGARVRLLGMPHWLIHDLPEEEQEDMRSFVGKTTAIEGIDAWGHYWVGFGFFTALDDAVGYTGHDFAITADFLELADARRKRARGRLRERQCRRRRKRK